MSIATSCDTLGTLIGLVFEQPKVSIKSFEVGDISADSLNFKLSLDVENPNPVGIKTEFKI